MSRVSIMSVMFLGLVVAACGAAAEEPGLGGSATVEQAVLDPCLTGCRQEHLACIRDCARSPDGTDCGCSQQLADCELSCPNADSDSDGAQNGVDNCPSISNPTQANCDGDAFGDVCDSLNASYQPVTSDHTCWTDKDTHFPHFTFENHVQRKEQDVSSCGAPDRFIGRVAASNNCFNISDFDCCIGLRFSIASFGDDPFFWCNDLNRDRNRCR
jgi:hypothetical protein